MTATVASANSRRSLTQAVEVTRTSQRFESYQSATGMPVAQAKPRRSFAGFLSALLRALAVAAA
jgi:hypothetical protein